MADQPDDTKGLIMIPNVGDMTFYLHTMMNDFTADLLLALSLMAGQLERKTMIQGPVIISPFFSSNGESGAGIESGTTGSAQGNGISIPQILSKDTNQTPNTPGTPLTTLNSNLHGIEKVKKRSPARVQKLMADLYLLAGRIEIAQQSYVNAIELCKLNNDLQWQASALEGYLCTYLVSIIRVCLSFYSIYICRRKCQQAKYNLCHHQGKSWNYANLLKRCIPLFASCQRDIEKLLGYTTSRKHMVHMDTILFFKFRLVYESQTFSHMPFLLPLRELL